MIHYLLDTNVIVDILRGRKPGIKNALLEKGIGSCAICDLSLFELFYGAFISKESQKNMDEVTRLVNAVSVLPSRPAYLFAAEEKRRLREEGLLIEDFDILIASTAAVNDLTLVTGNVGHMNRIKNVRIENWG